MLEGEDEPIVRLEDCVCVDHVIDQDLACRSIAAKPGGKILQRLIGADVRDSSARVGHTGSEQRLDPLPLRSECFVEVALEQFREHPKERLRLFHRQFEVELARLRAARGGIYEPPADSRLVKVPALYRPAMEAPR
jgi:hypothetical protein